MKFSSTLKFNAVPEWRDNYIDYDNLKKLIFKLEKLNVPAFQHDRENLNGKDSVSIFKKAVDKEAKKVDAFYRQIEAEIMHSVQELRTKMHQYTTESESNPARYLDGPTNGYSNHSYHDEPLDPDTTAEAAVASESSDDESPVTHRRKSTIHDELVQKKSIPFENVSLRREITRVYVQLNELLSYSDLNREGIRKAWKKFDKVHGSSHLTSYMEALSGLRAFSDEANHVVANQIDYLVASFATLTETTEGAAANMLSGMLREHVVYERNTVWRELIGLERQTEGVQHGNGSQSDNEKRQFTIRLNMGKLELAITMRAIKLIAIFGLFVISLMHNWLDSPVQSRCLSIVMLASLLWATEALPLFVTGLMIPFLVVVLKVPVDADGNVMSAKAASSFVFGKMWSPVIAVLLGGFALAAALSKYNIAKMLAQAILGRVGTDSPRSIILALMFVAAFLCMWISNVAAPVLCFSVAQPLLRIVPPGDSFSKALILGIALASNIGGTASPIASPQNILALQNMDPVASWFEWFGIALPVAIVGIVAVWAFLCLTFPISRQARESLALSNGPGAAIAADFGKVHVFVLVVSVCTIILWCFSHQLEPYVGDMGVLALVPLVLLFGSGVLTSADFNNFLWTIVALAMGGIVLGQSVESCGLLATVAGNIQAKVSGLPVFAISLTLGFAILILASFISHTVAALIVLPLVKSIGEQLDDPHPRLLVMVSALLCSCAMALPTSGFPNVTAVCMVDEVGKPYLTAMDFISRGVPASILLYIVVVTLGYALCRLMGF